MLKLCDRFHALVKLITGAWPGGKAPQPNKQPTLLISGAFPLVTPRLMFKLPVISVFWDITTYGD